ncbi:hypothetical protein ACRVX5_16595 [Clostridioides difficile]|nr:hypothetical protein [Clostridioides difficile]
MFTNFKVIMYMSSPVATVDEIILDSIISAAICKECFSEQYYSGKKKYGTKKEIEESLDLVLDKKMGVYCTSKAIGDNEEFVSSWLKQFDSKDIDFIKEKKTGKPKVSIAAGYFKSYHNQLNLKSYKTITFYVRGDKEKIKNLLQNNINFVGKKNSQGYGEILKYEFLDCDEDYSIFKDEKIMRPIPFREYMKLEKPISKEHFLKELPIIPPYWRSDHKELCIL